MPREGDTGFGAPGDQEARILWCDADQIFSEAVAAVFVRPRQSRTLAPSLLASSVVYLPTCEANRAGGVVIRVATRNQYFHLGSGMVCSARYRDEVMSNQETQSDNTWIDDSKFEPNRPSVDLVRRQRLLSYLDDGAKRRLVLLVAPAGYGKSSLLGQWVGEPDRESPHVAWLTLESGETDEKQFLSCLVISLSRVGAGLSDLVTGARNGFSDSNADLVVTKLIQNLKNLDTRMVMVLEDYHNAESDSVNAIVRRLLRSAIPKLSIFIDSRRQPNLEAFSLIAAGDAIEISATQLRLTEAETLSALRDLTDTEASLEIYKKTEGWPVAVQLARIKKRTFPDDPILAGVDGGVVASYLAEEVLASLDRDTQEFLLAVSFLDRFNPQLTNHVMDRPNGWGQIEALSSFAALFVPLDQRGNWYRLHHLFAEYLRDLQLRRDQELAHTYLLRASAWYQAQGETVLAVRYAAHARDYDRCEQLICDAGGWSIILTEGIGVLRNALRMVPASKVAGSPVLLIAAAYLHCKDGQIREARALLNAAVNKMDGDGNDRLMVDRVVVEAMINGYEDRPRGTPEYEEARAKLASNPAVTPLDLGTVKCDDYLISAAHGLLDRGADELHAAFAYMRESGSVLGLNYCYLHAALLGLLRADIETASANAERALAMAEENFGADSGLKNLALMLHYVLRVWQGMASQEDLAPLQESLADAMANDGWVDIYIVGLEAAVLLARQIGDTLYAADLTRQVMTFARDRELPRLYNYARVLRSHTAAGSTASFADLSIGLSDDDLPDLASSTHEWQANVAVLSGGGTFPPDRVQHIEAFVAENRIGLKEITLEVAATCRVLREGKSDEALLSLVKMVSPQRIWGPLIAEPAILRALGELRMTLRHNERELLAQRAVEEILARSKVLKPQGRDTLLSDREYEVLQNLATGQSNKQIARALELTENTVKFHMKSIFAKLAVNKRTQAILEAHKRGMID